MSNISKGSSYLGQRRAEGGSKISGVFRVKNHDFTPKNPIFSIAEGGAKIFEVFRVKNHEANIISIVFWCVLCHVRAMLPFPTVRSTSTVYQETVIRMLEETSEIYLYKFIVQQM